MLMPTTIEIRHGHLFCGLGGGAKGFNAARPVLGNQRARFRCVLNGAQSAAGREMHLCPMQFDIAERAITQFTNEGEEVFDPFGGLMTVPYVALKLKRRGRGCELSPTYFADGAAYCEAAARELTMPTLFDLEEVAA